MKHWWAPLALALFSLTACAEPDTLAYRLNEQGAEAYHAGRYGEALDFFRQAQVARPDYPELNINAGSALHKQREYERAGRELRRALSAQDARLRTRTHFNLGNNLYRSGHLPEAIDEYKWALRIDPDDPDAKHNLEFVLLQIQAFPNPDQQEGHQSGNQDPQQPQGNEPQEGGERQQAQPGQNNPAQSGTSPQNQGNQPQQPQEGALERALQEAGPELGIEDAIRILDALRERERAIQAQWNRGNTRVPPSERDW